MLNNSHSSRSRMNSSTSIINSFISLDNERNTQIHLRLSSGANHEDVKSLDMTHNLLNGTNEIISSSSSSIRSISKIPSHIYIEPKARVVDLSKIHSRSAASSSTNEIGKKNPSVSVSRHYPSKLEESPSQIVSPRNHSFNQQLFNKYTNKPRSQTSSRKELIDTQFNEQGKNPPPTPRSNSDRALQNFYFSASRLQDHSPSPDRPSHPRISQDPENLMDNSYSNRDSSRRTTRESETFHAPTSYRGNSGYPIITDKRINEPSPSPKPRLPNSPANESSSYRGIENLSSGSSLEIEDGYIGIDQMLKTKNQKVYNGVEQLQGSIYGYTEYMSKSVEHKYLVNNNSQHLYSRPKVSSSSNSNAYGWKVKEHMQILDVVSEGVKPAIRKRKSPSADDTFLVEHLHVNSIRKLRNIQEQITEDNSDHNSITSSSSYNLKHNPSKIKNNKKKSSTNSMGTHDQDVHFRSQRAFISDRSSCVPSLPVPSTPNAQLLYSSPSLSQAASASLKSNLQASNSAIASLSREDTMETHKKMGSKISSAAKNKIDEISSAKDIIIIVPEHKQQPSVSSNPDQHEKLISALQNSAVNKVSLPWSAKLKDTEDSIFDKDDMKQILASRPLAHAQADVQRLLERLRRTRAAAAKLNVSAENSKLFNGNSSSLSTNPSDNKEVEYIGKQNKNSRSSKDNKLNSLSNSSKTYSSTTSSADSSARQAIAIEVKKHRDAVAKSTPALANAQIASITNAIQSSSHSPKYGAHEDRAVFKSGGVQSNLSTSQKFLLSDSDNIFLPSEVHALNEVLERRGKHDVALLVSNPMAVSSSYQLPVTEVHSRNGASSSSASVKTASQDVNTDCSNKGVANNCSLGHGNLNVTAEFERPLHCTCTLIRCVNATTALQNRNHAVNNLLSISNLDRGVILTHSSDNQNVDNLHVSPNDKNVINEFIHSPSSPKVNAFDQTFSTFMVRPNSTLSNIPQNRDHEAPYHNHPEEIIEVVAHENKNLLQASASSPSTDQIRKIMKPTIEIDNGIEDNSVSFQSQQNLLLNPTSFLPLFSPQSTMMLDHHNKNINNSLLNEKYGNSKEDDNNNNTLPPVSSKQSVQSSIPAQPPDSPGANAAASHLASLHDAGGHLNASHMFPLTTSFIGQKEFLTTPMPVSSDPNFLPNSSNSQHRNSYNINNVSAGLLQQHYQLCNCVNQCNCQQVHEHIAVGNNMNVAPPPPPTISRANTRQNSLFSTAAMAGLAEVVNGTVLTRRPSTQLGGPVDTSHSKAVSTIGKQNSVDESIGSSLSLNDSHAAANFPLINNISNTLNLANRNSFKPAGEILIEHTSSNQISYLQHQLNAAENLLSNFAQVHMSTDLKYPISNPTHTSATPVDTPLPSQNHHPRESNVLLHLHSPPKGQHERKENITHETTQIGNLSNALSSSYSPQFNLRHLSEIAAQTKLFDGVQSDPSIDKRLINPPPYEDGEHYTYQKSHYPAYNLQQGNFSSNIVEYSNRNLNDSIQFDVGTRLTKFENLESGRSFFNSRDDSEAACCGCSPGSLVKEEQTKTIINEEHRNKRIVRSSNSNKNTLELNLNDSGLQDETENKIRAKETEIQSKGFQTSALSFIRSLSPFLVSSTHPSELVKRHLSHNKSPAPRSTTGNGKHNYSPSLKTFSGVLSKNETTASNVYHSVHMRNHIHDANFHIITSLTNNELKVNNNNKNLSGSSPYRSDLKSPRETRQVGQIVKLKTGAASPQSLVGVVEATNSSSVLIHDFRLNNNPIGPVSFVGDDETISMSKVPPCYKPTFAVRQKHLINHVMKSSADHAPNCAINTSRTHYQREHSNSSPERLIVRSPSIEYQQHQEVQPNLTYSPVRSDPNAFKGMPDVTILPPTKRVPEHFCCKFAKKTFFQEHVRVNVSLEDAHKLMHSNHLCTECVRLVVTRDFKDAHSLTLCKLCSTTMRAAQSGSIGKAFDWVSQYAILDVDNQNMIEICLECSSRETQMGLLGIAAQVEARRLLGGL